MFDYYISTEDEATMEAALIEAGIVVELPEIKEGDEVIRPRSLKPIGGVVLDVIGQWWEYDEITMTSSLIEGWHVNIRSEQEITFPENVHLASPSTPWRVFA